MAGPRKRRTIQQKSDGEQQEHMEIGETVTADFEGRNPDQSDFHGIKQLLKQLFLKSHINISELVDILIEQQRIGSVLKQALDDDISEDDDDTVFGITSVINLQTNKDKECVKQLLGLLRELVEKFGEQSAQDKIQEMISDSGKKIGLLVNERYLNIPTKIADPLMGSLQKEIEKFSKKNKDYLFDYFIMICKTYKIFNKDKVEEGNQFVNAEEEIFFKNCDVHFEFCVENESDTGVDGTWTEDDKQLLPYRKVLIINSKKFPNIVQNVKSFVA